MSLPGRPTILSLHRGLCPACPLGGTASSFRVPGRSLAASFSTVPAPNVPATSAPGALASWAGFGSVRGLHGSLSGNTSSWLHPLLLGHDLLLLRPQNFPTRKTIQVDPHFFFVVPWLQGKRGARGTLSSSLCPPLLVLLQVPRVLLQALRASGTVGCHTESVTSPWFAHSGSCPPCLLGLQDPERTLGPFSSIGEGSVRIGVRGRDRAEQSSSSW